MRLGVIVLVLAPLLALFVLGPGCAASVAPPGEAPPRLLEGRRVEEVIEPPSARPPRPIVPSEAREATKRATDAARAYMSRRTRAWLASPPWARNNFACATTCHTSLPMALAFAGGVDEAASALWDRVYARLNSVATWPAATPYFGASDSRDARASRASEAVLNATIAQSRVGPADPEARSRTLRFLWSVQRSDGGFDWMSYHNAPWEDGDEALGATLAWRLGGEGVEDRAHREALSRFLERRLPPARLFTRALALWAGGGRAPGLSSDAVAERLVQISDPSGGFSWGQLEVASVTSGPDAMPTSAALLALCSLPPSASVTTAAAAAEAWLLAHQAEDGSFSARSPNGESALHHELATDAGTGFAVVALDLCATREGAENSPP